MTRRREGGREGGAKRERGSRSNLWVKFGIMKLTFWMVTGRAPLAMA